ncbi:iron hydrogenase [Fomitiporia mediterranea MF3/22]|uniref:iron hydrogenase n=1 Tax=Fomitiporia mediterranea (strain MF3/22) TaxID=694068 RepID=UPI0004409C3D|nr:iron hydrogenase [Fomitiporia mediterranea MF3/22]EJD02950.1 iron hydrogenase [Fomitiporia mediterranea MF3/22]
MAFSGALTLTDLNDFITPSQACIKPVQQSNPQTSRDEGAASTQIRIDSSGAYYEVSSTDASDSKTSARKLETAQISLNDCLACSGCITSAESVLITMQSHEEVLNVLASNPSPICVDHKTPVLSISPQSLASLAATISSTSTNTVALAHVFHRVAAFARELGFEHVYDTTFARHLALLEHAHEFHERKHGTTNGIDGEDAAGKLPMLASACPGWVCYAEKTHAEMLPFISRTKSPQQVMGTLVKNWLSEKWGKKPNQIYHVTVMPCYDKKLEASRQDFYNDLYSTRDVDCVITTGELQRMMRERNWAWDLLKPVPGPSETGIEVETSLLSKSKAEEDEEDTIPIPKQKSEGPSYSLTLPSLLLHPGSSSGSYLHSLLSTIQDTAHLSGQAEPKLTIRQVRGADFEEYLLRAPDTGKIVFKGARCYGFRNLQNVVRRVGRAAGVQVGRGAAGRLANVRAKTRIKRRTANNSNGAIEGDNLEEEEDRPYDYVEVMACPGGCVNGGGQLPPLPIPNSETEGAANGGETERWGTRAWTRRVEEAYWTNDLPTPPPSPPPLNKVATLHEPEKKTLSTRLEATDELALRVLSDLCNPSQPLKLTSWSQTMDPTAESLRRTYFRTSYHAVVSEVSGIQVQW